MGKHYLQSNVDFSKMGTKKLLLIQCADEYELKNIHHLTLTKSDYERLEDEIMSRINKNN